MEFIKLTKGTDAITIFNNLGFFKLSKDSGGEDLPATPSLVYTLSSDGTYYIVGTGFTSIEEIDADTSGGTVGSGLDSTWSGGQLVIPAEHNGLPVKAIAPKSFNAVKNITDAYISDGITCIGHRAFQCSEADGFDTTMTYIRFPNTLLTLGGIGENGAGRVLWGRQGLTDVEINFGNVTNNLCMLYQFAYTKANTITINVSIRAPKENWYQYMFRYAEINKVIFGENFVDMYPLTLNAFSNMFSEAKINDVYFVGTTYYGTNKGKPFSNALSVKNLHFPKLRNITYTADKPFSGFAGRAFLGGETCGIKDTYCIPNAPHIDYKYIDNYSSATNWTSIFPTGTTGSNSIFVYGDFNEGDTLPRIIGTTMTYLVTWHEDSVIGTVISETAKATTRYYGTIAKTFS